MSTIIILGVAMFTFVILALVFILLAAKARLVNSEAVTIGINHDPNHSLRVPAGNTLLNTLASNKIFIPSACGGKGSCGRATATPAEIMGLDDRGLIAVGARADLVVLDEARSYATPSRVALLDRWPGAARIGYDASPIGPGGVGLSMLLVQRHG